jgi:dienelactone hydrolase
VLAVTVAAAAATGATAAASPRAPVRVLVLRLVDRSRRAHFRDGTSTVRVLTTAVRYPSHDRGPFPLIVFAHGFALTPNDYTDLLDAWVRAGYLVAAPLFPVENSDAPGGPARSDLLNEPGDISFVISRLTERTSPLQGLIDPTRIAVAGQSDGAVAALSVAYDRRFLDRRVDAAAVLSGAAARGFLAAARGSPPLLAVQGTRDPVNVPASTRAYFRRMRRPKFLLWLIGATHLPPYTSDDRWAAVVEQATTAFFNHYLRGAPLRPLIAAGTRPSIARILSRR